MLIKYHKKLNREYILHLHTRNRTDEKVIEQPIYREKNHFVGIEFSFEKRKWLWNTDEEVDDEFWLQSKAGNINNVEPQLRDKLIYTMSEQSTDPSIDSLQDLSLQIIELFHPLVCRPSWKRQHIFASSFSNLEWLQRANVDTIRPVAQNIISYDKDTKLLIGRCLKGTKML